MNTIERIKQVCELPVQTMLDTVNDYLDTHGRKKIPVDADHIEKHEGARAYLCLAYYRITRPHKIGSVL